MDSKIAFNALARIEDVKPGYTKGGSDNTPLRTQPNAEYNNSSDSDSTYETNKSNLDTLDTCLYDQSKKSFDSDFDILDLLKSYKYKRDDLLLSLNIDYSLNMVNLDWWRMGRATYGFEFDHNYVQIPNRSIKKSDPVPCETCPICIDNLTNDVVSLNGCLHKFHMECVNEYKNNKKHLKNNLVCPLCSIISLPGRGPSPRGTMSWSLSNKDIMLDGNNLSGVLKIKYTMEPGTQMRCHPQPGSPHSGAHFKAYLPLTDEYISLLKLFILAFSDGQTFTIKTKSIGESQPVYVDWNIEHKYNLQGGPSNFGYPDVSYLERVSSHIIDLLNDGVK